MQDRRKLVLQVAASAVVLAVAALAGWFYFGNGGTAPGVAPEESTAARKERRNDRREEQAADLRRVLEARRRAPEVRPEQLAIPITDSRPSPEERSPARLTSAEQAALRGVMESFFSPERLRDALASRTAPDLVREMSRRYGEAFGAESLGGPADAVPVGPAVREALQRMGLLKDYGMNLLHAQRPDGQEALQSKMIERVNSSFAGRIDALNADYPFLGVRLVEP